ncbi:MAG TPA: TlpA family protein disulfide reductase [Candidatus Aminicenantes bacterium]|nr:TlpA family protein disulfide reductase [Candidatus Aminicenantes bacterium]
MKRNLRRIAWLVFLIVMAACSGDPDARFMEEWNQIKAEFTPLFETVARSDKQELEARYKEKLEALAQSAQPGHLCDSSRLTYAEILLELKRIETAESFLLPLASHSDPDLHIRALKMLIRAAAARKDADALRQRYKDLDSARNGELEKDAPLLLEAGSHMRDADLELALELIDRGLSHPIPESAVNVLNTAIHIRFVDGGLGHSERGVFLERMARQYADRPQIITQIQRKQGFLEFLGRPAPELDQPGTWLNSDGPLQLKELRGRYILLDFFAPWCPDCRNSLPEFRQLGRKLKDRMATILITRFYGFYADENTPARRNLSKSEELSLMKDYLENKEVEMPVFVAADEETHNRFNASAIPHYVLISPDGNVVDLCMERVHGFFTRVEAQVLGEQ